MQMVSGSRSTRFFRVQIILYCTLLALVIGIPSPSSGAPPKEARKTYFLVLEGETAGEVHARMKGKNSEEQIASAVNNRRATIQKEQDALVTQLHARGHLISGRFSHVLNALRVHASPQETDWLRSLPGVKRLEPVRHKRPLLSTSVPFVGGPQVWGSASGSADGSGVRIGIIDTGIDYTHADFGGIGSPNAYTVNDRTRIEPGTFPTTKVVGGYDFVGDSYDASTPGLDVPQPDPDPLDCNSHGTHVAGIAAGFGVRTNGLAYTGAYTNNLDYSQFSIGPGVAPRASLYALKVFGCNGSTDADIDALEWAATAGTGNFNNHLDVVNLSLGGVFGFTGPSVENDAITQLVNLGCTVVVAAGNSGNTFFIVSSPGTADRSICVANSMIGGAIQVVSPGTIAGAMAAVEGDFTLPISQSIPVQAQLVYVSPNDGCNPLSNAANLSGKIALIDRGTCFFADKIQRAQSAGAIAVIMVNNVPGDPITMGGSGSELITIPGVMISQSDGALLKAHLAESPIVRLGTDVTVAYPEFSDRIESGSSRGPAAPLNLLKPEIAAPGTAIHSAAMGTGSGGVNFTGTSMATPHVAGAAALIRQLHPSWSVDEIKAALMNTARLTRDGAGHPYPESRAGAGRVQVSDAARAIVTAKAQNSSGLVTLNLGALEIASTLTRTENIVLQNHGNVAMTYTIAVSNTVTEPGFSVLPLQSQVTVPAKSSAPVSVQFTANPALFDRTADPTTPSMIAGQSAQNLFEVSGQIWFLNQALSIHVPYYANVRAASAYSTGFSDLASSATDTPIDIAVPTYGSSAHPQPLVSAFQLGARSPNQNLSNPARAFLDILAVGAASDASSQSLFGNSTVYFGVAVSGNWTSPQTFIADLRIQIDLNFDGVPDLEILDSTAGNASNSNLFDGNSSSGVFLSVLTDSWGDFVSSGGYLNIFPANVRDTAPFNNSVMVLSVPTQLLGLYPGSSQINYRLVAVDSNNVEVEQTPWSLFDIAQPLIDTTVHGLNNKPFFGDGSPINIRITRSAVANNGLPADGTAGLLLLHHFNRAGSKTEIVNFHLNEDSTVPFKLLPPETVGEGRKLTWTSLPNAFYSVEYSTNLANGFPFHAATGLSATPPFNSFVDTTPRGSTVFYRIRKE
jgi:subtilisin family serine protease